MALHSTPRVRLVYISGVIGPARVRRCEKMPRHGECRKINPCFPKDSVDIVGHIMTEANFFTPSERGR
jgi:hypothetical protein